jgi:hypothetical protein
MATVKKICWFTMVNHPERGWIRVGNAYVSHNEARAWFGVVSGAWKGLRVKASRCTVTLVDRELDAASKKVLSEKYNLDPPAKKPEGGAG